MYSLESVVMWIPPKVSPLCVVLILNIELSLQLNRMPLALLANLATKWRHLHSFQFWPQDGTLHWLHIRPPDGTTCISCKFAHQMVLLALLSKFTTRLHHLYCNIALFVSFTRTFPKICVPKRACAPNIRICLLFIIYLVAGFEVITDWVSWWRNWLTSHRAMWGPFQRVIRSENTSYYVQRKSWLF